jgi:hypothetical protein
LVSVAAAENGRDERERVEGEKSWRERDREERSVRRGTGMVWMFVGLGDASVVSCWLEDVVRAGRNARGGEELRAYCSE